MANTIEKLAIELEIDTDKVVKFFDQFAEKLGDLVIAAKKAGVDVDSVINGAGDGSKNAENLKLVSDNAKEAGDTLKEAGNKGRQVGKDVEQGSKQAQGALKQLDSVAGKVASALKSYFAPMAAMFGAKLMFTGFLDEANKLDKLSSSVRMNVSDLDAWRKANVAAGGSAEAFTNAMKSFTERTGASGEVFLRMGAQLNGMTGRQAEYAMKYMGLSRESASIFLENNARMKELVGSYRALALTPKDAENARRFRLAWQTTGLIVNSIGAHFARFFLPIVEKVVDTFRSCALFINKHSQLIRVALGLIGATALAVFGPRSILATLPKLFALIFSPLGLLVAGIAALSLAFDDLLTFMDGGDSVFEDLLRNIGYTDSDIKKLKQSFQDAKTSLGELWDATKPVRDILKEAFGAVVVSAVNLLVGTVGGLSKALVDIINNAKRIGKTFSETWESAKKEFQKFTNSCTEIWNKFLAIFDKFKLPDFLTPDEKVKNNLKEVFNFDNDEEKKGNRYVISPPPSNNVGNVQGPVSKTANMNSNVSVENNININGKVDDVTKIQEAVNRGTSQGLNLSMNDLLAQATSSTSY